MRFIETLHQEFLTNHIPTLAVGSSDRTGGATGGGYGDDRATRGTGGGLGKDDTYGSSGLTGGATGGGYGGDSYGSSGRTGGGLGKHTHPLTLWHCPYRWNSRTMIADELMLYRTRRYLRHC